jgi:hypothetical protein
MSILCLSVSLSIRLAFINSISLSICLSEQETSVLKPPSLNREKNTRNYLIAYTIFNTGAHVAAISTVYSLDPDFDGEEGIVDKVGRRADTEIGTVS